MERQFSRPLRWLLTTLLISCLPLFATAAPQDKLPTSPQKVAEMDQLLQSFIQQQQLSSVAVMVLHKGQLAYANAFGWKDIEAQQAASLDDYYVLFSQTKAIISVAFMTLVEQGKVRLEDPVVNYFPDIPQQVLVRIDNDGQWLTRPVTSQMTFAHLLAHTAGFNAGLVPQARWGDSNASDLPALVWDGKPVHVTPAGQHSASDDYQRATLAEEMQALARWPLGFDPGSAWHYHVSTNMLAYLIERISGEPLQQYVARTVLQPLGMQQTAWFYPAERLSRFVKAYSRIDGKLVPQANLYAEGAVSAQQTYAEGAIGLNGPIADYARFCQMLLNGGEWQGKRILSADSIAQMTRINRLPPQDNGFRFGLGFELFSNARKPAPQVGEHAYGWGGMMGTGYLIDPDNQLVLLYYINMYQRPDLYPQVVAKAYELFVTDN